MELPTEEEMAEEQNMEDVYHIFNLTECSSDIDSAFKRPRLRISRIDGQARKIENPDNLPEEHLWGTIFENVIVIF